MLFIVVVVVLSYGTLFLACGSNFESVGVTVKMKPLLQFFHKELYVFQNFTKELWEYLSNRDPSQGLMFSSNSIQLSPEGEVNSGVYI